MERQSYALRPAGLAPIQILLVDDAPAVVKVMARLLSRIEGVSIVGKATSGGDALWQTQRLRPDLVVMDLEMPGMNGLEATRRIKALERAPQVVILTLHDDPEYQTAAAAAGADGFVSKSELISQLLPIIQRLFSL